MCIPLLMLTFENCLNKTVFTSLNLLIVLFAVRLIIVVCWLNNRLREHLDLILTKQLSVSFLCFYFSKLLTVFFSAVALILHHFCKKYSSTRVFSSETCEIVFLILLLGLYFLRWRVTCQSHKNNCKHLFCSLQQSNIGLFIVTI